MVFPVVMCRCESWSIKKVEHQRIDAFKLWCWRRLLRVPWTTRSSNQSILKEINPEYSLEGLRLKLKCQYFDHLMWRVDLFEKTLMLGKIEGRGRRGQQRLMASPTQWTWVWVNSRSWWRTGKPGMLQSMGSQGVGHNWLTEPNWTETWFSQSGYSAVRIHLPMQEIEFSPWVRKMPWRRKWQPTLVLYPGKSQGQRSLKG